MYQQFVKHSTGKIKRSVPWDAGKRKLADEMGWTRSRIDNALGVLEELGWVMVATEGKRSTFICVLHAPVYKMVGDPAQPAPRPKLRKSPAPPKDRDGKIIRTSSKKCSGTNRDGSPCGRYVRGATRCTHHMARTTPGYESMPGGTATPGSEPLPATGMESMPELAQDVSQHVRNRRYESEPGVLDTAEKGYLGSTGRATGIASASKSADEGQSGKPAATPTFQPDPKIGKEGRLSVYIDRIHVWAPFNEAFIADCKTIWGREYDPIRKTWSFPWDAVPEVVQLANKWHLTIPDEIVEEIDYRAKQPTTYGYSEAPF